MKFITADGVFETENQAIENVLNTQVAKHNPINGRHPVCVKRKISARKTSFGMQFWTLEMIKDGVSINDDKSISILC
jgi:hypothetical protein